MTLLQAREKARADERARLWRETREQLRAALRELLPGVKVVLFGSVTNPARFNRRSDIDLALFTEPAAISVFGLMAQLEERLARPVDVVLLPQSRFKKRILEQGEIWTTSD
jgi:predicted nucleotidyltransferase